MAEDEDDGEEEESYDEQRAEGEFAYGTSQGGYAAYPDEKQNVFTFLTKVVEEEDTTKLGYLTEEELGMPKFPLRTEKELELFCNIIADMPYFAEYFKKEGEILTSTSLSKDAKLLDLAVIQRREVQKTKPKRKPNKSWFKRGNKSSGG